MALDSQTLKDQLIKAENEFEQAKAVLYRLDGAIQVLKLLITNIENPLVTTTNPHTK